MLLIVNLQKPNSAYSNLKNTTFVAMRTLILTLSIITLFSSVFPCCFTEQFCDSASFEICDDTSQSDHDVDHLPCSPFFSCGNCTGFISPSFDQISFIQESILTSKIISYKSLNTYNFCSPSFKPPKARYRNSFDFA